MTSKTTLNNNLSALQATPESLPSIVIALRNCIKAIQELQLLQVAVAKTDSLGRPQDGSMCDLLKGQFLHLTQTTAAPNLVTVPHQLGRKPQGAIFIDQTAANKVYIAGDITQSIEPATKDRVTFKLNGSIGDTHICILI